MTLLRLILVVVCVSMFLVYIRQSVLGPIAEDIKFQQDADREWKVVQERTEAEFGK